MRSVFGLPATARRDLVESFTHFVGGIAASESGRHVTWWGDAKVGVQRT
jgi:hypothetical protein